MTQPDKPDYRLVYDGEGGLRMAPSNVSSIEPEPHIAWNPDGEARLETRLDRDPAAFRSVPAPRRSVAIAGVLLFCLIGAGVGLAMRLPKAPDMTHPAAPPAGQVQVQVNADAPPPLPAAVKAAPRMDVLPADIEQRIAPAAPAPTRLAAIPPPAATPGVRLAPSPAPAARAPLAAEDDAAVAAPAPRVRRADCAWTRSRAETLVCNDPDLAAADRRLSRAYRGAARSGVDQMQLRAEQDDWLDLREAAARSSRGAVAQLYAQRIEELEAMADPQ